MGLAPLNPSCDGFCNDLQDLYCPSPSALDSVCSSGPHLKQSKYTGVSALPCVRRFDSHPLLGQGPVLGLNFPHLSPCHLPCQSRCPAAPLPPFCKNSCYSRLYLDYIVLFFTLAMSFTEAEKYPSPTLPWATTPTILLWCSLDSAREVRSGRIERNSAE